MTTFTIGQVAKRSGFSASALRFYERHDLLEPSGRSEAGYRLYDMAALNRLAFIASAKQLGLSLPEIADVLAVFDAGECGPTQQQLRSLVDAKISEALAKIEHLQEFIADLENARSFLAQEKVNSQLLKLSSSSQQRPETTNSKDDGCCDVSWFEAKVNVAGQKETDQ